jgi:pentatricopeptide repeat protein
LPVNNAVCTSAVKAYGRLRNSGAAVHLWHWLEGTLCQAVDTQFLSAVLHVCAKAKKVQLAERIFWTEFPVRNLPYATATVNSMIFLYAKLKRADEALRVYQEVLVARSMPGNIVTYGALVKVSAKSQVAGFPGWSSCSLFRR